MRTNAISHSWRTRYAAAWRLQLYLALGIVGAVSGCGDDSTETETSVVGARRIHTGADGSGGPGADAAVDGGFVETPLVGPCTPCERLSAELVGFERCCTGPFAELCGLRPMGAEQCDVDCRTDDDCQVMGDDYVCVDRIARFCVPGCSTHDDCPKGELCALRENESEDRIDTFCSPPVGPGEVGDECLMSDDCASGTCTAGPVEGSLCTALCVDDSECGGSFSRCRRAGVVSPSGEYETDFDICLEP